MAAEKGESTSHPQITPGEMTLGPIEAHFHFISACLVAALHSDLPRLLLTVLLLTVLSTRACLSLQRSGPVLCLSDLCFPLSSLESREEIAFDSAAKMANGLQRFAENKQCHTCFII